MFWLQKADGNYIRSHLILRFLDTDSWNCTNEEDSGCVFTDPISMVLRRGSIWDSLGEELVS